MLEKYFGQIRLIELYEEILDSIENGIVVVDEDFNILFMNERLRKIHGSGYGKDFHKEILGLDEKSKNCPVMKTFKDRRPHEREVFTGRRHLLLKSFPIKGRYEKKHAIVVIEETTYKKPFEFLLKTEGQMLKDLGERNQKLVNDYNKLKRQMLKIAREYVK